MYIHTCIVISTFRQPYSVTYSNHVLQSHENHVIPSHTSIFNTNYPNLSKSPSNRLVNTHKVNPGAWPHLQSPLFSLPDTPTPAVPWRPWISLCTALPYAPCLVSWHYWHLLGNKPPQKPPPWIGHKTLMKNGFLSLLCQ